MPDRPAEQAPGADPAYDVLCDVLYDLIWALYDEGTLTWDQARKLGNKVARDVAVRGGAS